MKSWKEEKLNRTSKETKTLHEDYLRPDYDDENYKEAYKLKIVQPLDFIRNEANLLSA